MVIEWGHLFRSLSAILQHTPVLIPVSAAHASTNETNVNRISAEAKKLSAAKFEAAKRKATANGQRVDGHSQRLA